MTDERQDLLTIWDEHRSLNPVVGHLCPYCAAARRRATGPCANCTTLRQRFDRALDGLWVITLASTECPAYRWVDQFKRGWPPQDVEDSAAFVAAVMSLWWEQHESEVKNEHADLVATTLGTNHAILRAAAEVARTERWPFPALTSAVHKAPGVLAQRSLDKQGRLQRDPEDWVVDQDLLGDSAEVLLLDDIYTTGASMHSAARALKDAGASGVSGLAFVRMLSGFAYFEELNWRGRNVPVLWTPERIWGSAK